MTFKKNRQSNSTQATAMCFVVNVQFWCQKWWFSSLNLKRQSIFVFNTYTYILYILLKLHSSDRNFTLISFCVPHAVPEKALIGKLMYYTRTSYVVTCMLSKLLNNVVDVLERLFVYMWGLMMADLKLDVTPANIVDLKLDL